MRRDVELDRDNVEQVEDALGDGANATPRSPERPSLSTTREFIFVAVLCCTQLMTQAAFGAVLIPLHVIGDDLGTSSTGQLSWFCASYSLTVGTFVLIAGRLGDIYGHKRLFVSGWLWFGLWSLVAAFSAYSSTPVLFDVCRALQGIGPAILLPNALAILGRAYGPGKRKDMVFALFACTAPVGCVVGGLMGAALAEYSWWPWIFWLNAIVCVLLALVGSIAIPASTVATTETQTFDTYGALLGVTALILINFSWNQAPIVGWSTPYVYVVLILGLVCLAVFGWFERIVEQPLVPTRMLDADAGCILVCVALGWSSFGVWMYYTFQLMEELRGTTALIAAVQFLPETVMGITAAIATGYLLSRVDASWLMVAALSAFCAGCILSATAPVQQTYWANIFVSMMIMAWGMDISFPASTLMLSNKVPAQHQGMAASLINTIVNYSISIGLGIAGTVESLSNAGGTQVEKGYRDALYTAVGLSGLGVIVSLACAVRTSVRSK